MSIPEQDESAKVHSRDISISTYSTGEDAIIVEGVLLEKRLKDHYMLSGEKKSAGVLHHMVIKMRVQGPEKTITEIDVEMPGIPREGCIELKDSLLPLVGFTLSAGFTRRVLELVGGVNGCFHLVSLLLAMAPAAMQGYFANRALRPFNMEDASLEEVLGSVPLNSCKMWREDGPIITAIREWFSAKKA